MNDRQPLNRPLPHSRQYVESLSRGYRLLRILCESRSALGLSELAKMSQLSISNIQRLTFTLQQLGLVDRDRKTKKFRIGPQMIWLALTVINHFELNKIARPYMAETSRQIGEAVGLGVLSGTQIILTEIVKTDQLLNINTNPGAIIPPHATATGKVILAFLGEAEVKEILDSSGMAVFTPNTIASAERFRQVLASVRQDGFAIAMDENAEGFSAVAAPVRNGSGEVLAAITIMLPSFRVSHEKLMTDFKEAAIRTAADISLALGFNPQRG